MPDHRSVSKFCLQFECVSDESTSLARLERALQAIPVTSVILSGHAGASVDTSTLQSLVELAQARGIAALIQADFELARILRADGVHVPWDTAIATSYGRAREALGAKFIVGADAGRSRHDAMALAEAGADYIGFGIPGHVEDRVTAAQRRLDLAGWWAEIFEIPVMALDVDAPSDVAMLNDAKVDFISLKLLAGTPLNEVEPLLLALNAARAGTSEAEIAVK